MTPTEMTEIQTEAAGTASEGIASSQLKEGSMGDPTYPYLILYSTIIGVVGGLVATAYYYLMQGSFQFVWHSIPDWLAQTNFGKTEIPYVIVATTIGGCLVGLTLRLMGLPGEVAFVVDQVHDPGRIDVRQTPAMTIASLISIVAGGSAGPEAPLVQIIGSFGGWLGQKLKLTLHTVRILTFCGMSAALGAFFGAPLGGALFALEIPHRRGLEYYEAIVPAVLSAIFSFWVFRTCTGLSIGGMYHLSAVPNLSLISLFHGAILGAVGALAAVLFVGIFRAVGYVTHSLGDRRILLGGLGGLSIGLIAIYYPETLFFGEKQIETIIESGASLGVTLLLSIAIAKMLAISCTLHSGFRGGFIFPLFYVGATLGYAIALAFPQIHPTIGIVCLMAAVNVAITKTPISTTVILSVIADTSMVPVIVIATFTSFLLTTQVSLISTQRSRSSSSLESLPVFTNPINQIPDAVSAG